MPEIVPKGAAPTAPIVPAPMPTIIPKSEMMAKAEKIREARALPPKPGDNVSFKELNEWIKLLTPEMTDDNRIFIYLYRLDPPIIRQKVDPDAPNNIDVIADLDPTRGITEQQIIDRHGGGKYKLVVRDQDKNKSVNGFFSARLHINQIDHPAKLDLREVNWDDPYSKGYKAYCRANRLIDENNMPITPDSVKKQDAAESSNATIAAMKLVMEYTSQMNKEQQAEFKKRLGGEDSINKTFNDIILEKMKQEDPNKQLTALTTILTAMKSMQPTDNTLATIMPMFLQMMQQMTESSNRQFQMMMEMMKSNSGNGGSKDTITEVKELFTLFQDMNGGSVKKSTAEVVGSIVETNLTPVLNIISQVVNMKAMAMMNGTGGIPMPPASTPSTQAPQATPGSQANPLSNPSPHGPAATPQNAAIGLPSPNEATQIISQFGPIIVNRLAGEGWEFGMWIAEGFGDATAAGIARMGVENLLAGAKSVPQFWNQIMSTYGEEYLRKWLTSFVNYKVEMAKMEQDDDDEEEELEIK